MPAATHDFAIEQGSAFSITFQYFDTNQIPIDLTNYCILLQWMTNTNELYTFSNKESSSNYSLTVDNFGKVILQIPSKTTNNYNFDFAVYDLDVQEPNEQYSDSGLKTYRLVTGRVNIIKRNIAPALSNCANITADYNLVDLCNIECGKLDIYSRIYAGSGIIISDNINTDSFVQVNDLRAIENIELSINGLRHSNPQDLSIILHPASGNSILLLNNTKITNYAPGFSCMFSNKASSNAYISNIISGSLCNILDKTATFTLPSIYPVRAIHVGGSLVFSNGTLSKTYSPSYNISNNQNSFEDLRVLGTAHYGENNLAINLTATVNRILNENPGYLLQSSSLELVLLDNINRIVGWGTTSTLNNRQSTHGNSGYMMNINIFDFPAISDTSWVLGSDVSNNIYHRPTPYKIIASAPACNYKESASLYPYMSHLFDKPNNGNWRLQVIDNSSGADGTIDSWNLIITYKEQS